MPAFFRPRVHVFAVLFISLVLSCSSSGSSKTGDHTIVRSSLARDTNPQAPDADVAAVVAGNTDFALKVLPLLDPDPGKNTFFSPYSITQAFALLAPGARGTTLSEIESLLFSSLTQDRLNPAMNKLALLLTSHATGEVLQSGLQTPILRNANALWGQKDVAILPEYLDALAINFDAGLHIVDFINNTEPSRQTINRWVEEQTNSRIQNLIPQGGVSDMTRLVLTNAIWFRADWASQFVEQATVNQSFFNRDGSASSLPFMKQQLVLPYAQTAGCQAVDFPYAGENLSMLVIMPDAGSFDVFLSSLTPTILHAITSSLSTAAVDLSLPKFTFSSSSSMKQILESLGMVEAFDPARADLSGIDGQRDLFVGAVFHQAFVAVDEKGTEAAAATAIIVGTTGYPTPDATLTVDHPFLFFIRDRLSGLILFMGKVVSL